MPRVIIMIEDVGDNVAINVIHDPPIDVKSLTVGSEITGGQFLGLVAMDAIHKEIDSEMNAEKAAEQIADGSVKPKKLFSVLEKKPDA